ncbi:MAG: hypothetical protein HYT89_06345 [Candidatus Omnitrophica bacterium]|nr:hypothetical protein [Candidatus Omnitrophota bacterium]
MSAQNKRTSFLVFCAAAVLAAGLVRPVFAASIVHSKHNLSASGTGSVKAVAESEVCIFCHIPHNANSQAPLWSRYETGRIYIPYTSATMKASAGQPTGASKLCLSCHDGTVAMGMVRSRQTSIPFTGPLTPQTNLGIDLSDDHPVSFTYDSSLTSRNPTLQDPSALTGRVRLDRSSQMQCTSCHDPHNDEFGDFLVINPANSALCTQCHNQPGWAGSPHNLSPKPFSGVPVGQNPPRWGTVAQVGCQACHTPHAAGGKKRLLYFSEEEKNCTSCHDGRTSPKNIAAELNKPSAHPVRLSTGLHDPAENALLRSPRHAECADCHNPHAADDRDAGRLPGSLRSVKGVNAAGEEINPVNFEYELCFRCHADTAAGKTYVNRQFAETNTRLEFDPANASYHPVENIGKNPDVPSLIAPYTASSVMECTSCHNNNAGPNRSGTGPNGPHGSVYAPLLERQMSWSDGLSESPASYALCYKCHDRNNLLDDRSFPSHKKHVQEAKASCLACHDPHGVKDTTHLINFDSTVVTPNAVGRLSFEDLGRFKGRCYLSCHGKDHNPKSY